MPEPGLYVGTVRHRRFSPARHEFTYPLFMSLLDIDRLPDLMNVSPFTSYNRFNWASFHDEDHLGSERRPVRAKLEDVARRAGVTLPGGQILLLTHLRYLGYIFNPVSFYYCYDTHGRLDTVLADVSNTYGGRQTYWLTRGTAHSVTGGLSFRTRKTLYVSPFLPVGLEWTFFFSQLGDTALVHMTAVEDGKRATLDATLILSRTPWSASNLHRALARFPAMTVSVIASIHWEALRLYWKGVPVVPRPTTTGMVTRPDENAEARSL
ncbi:MAG: DUF1365 domain-containing protein [Vicinamibacterales bacterium]